MPLLKLETNAPLDEEQRQPLLAALSKTVSEIVGKPEQYVMVTFHPGTALMSGKADHAAFVDVRSIGGLGGSVTRELSQKICAVLNERLGLSPDRVYLNFTDVPAANWGWNGNTFG